MKDGTTMTFDALLRAPDILILPGAHDALSARVAVKATTSERLGFTGRVESTLKTRLGRPVDPSLADTGRLLGSAGQCHVVDRGDRRLRPGAVRARQDHRWLPRHPQQRIGIR